MTKLTAVLKLAFIALMVIGLYVLIFCPEYCGEWSARFDNAYNKTYLKYWNR